MCRVCSYMGYRKNSKGRDYLPSTGRRKKRMEEEQPEEEEKEGERLPTDRERKGLEGKKEEGPCGSYQG